MTLEDNFVISGILFISFTTIYMGEKQPIYIVLKNGMTFNLRFFISETVWQSDVFTLTLFNLK